MAPAEPRREPRKDYLPPPVNRLDREVLWFSILPVSLWESPKSGQAVMLSVRSRPSAVFNAVSARKADWEQSLLPSAFVVVAALFLIVEIVSLIAGISLSRTITAAVHGLYEATLRVREADFSHRIQVQGNDQLADLSHSFNSMTENLERLLAVAKEKERLAIRARDRARGAVSALSEGRAGAQGARVCRPAATPRAWSRATTTTTRRSADHRLALAIGDVAGKGISAALLMATVESCVRTQIRHCLRGGRAGNGQPPAVDRRNWWRS